MIHIKSQREIQLMREAGAVADTCMSQVEAMVRPGVTTGEIDRMAEAFIRNAGGIPTFLGFGGYPASLCISINDVVVHGIPDRRKLVEGDIVSIDLGVTLGGYVADMARTFACGAISKEAEDLIQATKESFYKGMEQMVPGNRLGDVSHAVGRYAESLGYGVVRDLCGHGVGAEMHEDPEVPNYGTPGRGVRLRSGMVLAVEPMITAGTWRVNFMPDGWSVTTADGSLAAHYENTVAITDDGPVILTTANPKGR